MPFKKKKSVEKRYKVVRLKDFWPWAEENKMIFDFSRLERGTLGPEPSWVEHKRIADTAALKYKMTDPWEPEEDELLTELVRAFKYSYREISIRLGRRKGAIKRRLSDLGLKERPLKAGNHNAWTLKEEAILIDMYYKGYIAEVMAEKIPGRSALAIKGKIERMVKEGRLNSARCLPGMTLERICVHGKSGRLFDEMKISGNRRKFVNSRPESERQTIRKFGTMLINSLEKLSEGNDVNFSPSAEKIGDFMTVFREVYRGGGEMAEGVEARVDRHSLPNQINQESVRI